MSRPRNHTPSYLLHQRTGHGRAVWTDANGIRRERSLPGAYGSKESKEAFARLLVELQTDPSAATFAGSTGLTINEICAAHLDHAEKHYRRSDGTPTAEVGEYKRMYRAMRTLYGDMPAAEFGPLAFKAVRQSMIDAGACRGVVNQRASRVRRIFKWAVAEELVKPEVYLALAAVPGLQRGRTEARETECVKPVDDAMVDGTMPYLSRYVRGLVEFQRLTGCQPGEAVLVRRADIDTSGAVWLYRPGYHKLAYRGSPRVVAIGPRAQALLRDYFTPTIEDYLFSPRRAIDEHRAAKRAARKTKLQPSQFDRRNPEAVKLPGECYAVTSYTHAIYRACKRAGVDPWHPNQLRHNFATAVRKQHGLEAAQVLLGHSRADVTQVYAERNQELNNSSPDRQCYAAAF
jgi:integrase